MAREAESALRSTALDPVDHTARTVWLVWCAAYVSTAALGLWLWRGLGVVSMELLFLDARARIAATAPLASELLLSLPPLVFLPSLVSGSAMLGVALVTASTMAGLCAVLRGAGRSIWWLALLAAHPVLLIGGLEHPTVVAELGAIVVSLGGMLFYMLHRRLDWLTCGGLALGALVLVDWHAWPLALVVAAIMALWHRGERLEKATLVLIVLFPPVGMMVAWMAFNTMITGSPFAFLESPLLALAHTDAWGVAQEQGSRVGALGVAVMLAPLAVIAPVWALKAARGDERTGWCLALLALSPLALALVRGGGGDSAEPLLVAGAYGVSALVITLGLMPASQTQQIVAAVLVLSGLAAGHGFLFARPDTEPARLARRAAAHDERVGRLADLRACADDLNARLRDGDRVLFDDVQLFPLAGLLDSRDAWISSSTAEFEVARQQPARWARFVLDVRADSSPARRAVRFDEATLARDYVLVRAEGELRLFELRPSAAKPARQITFSTRARSSTAAFGPAESVGGATRSWGS